MVESVIILVRRREGISRMPKKYSLLVVDGCRFSGNSRARLRPIRPRVDVLDEVSSDIDPYYAWYEEDQLLHPLSCRLQHHRDHRARHPTVPPYAWWSRQASRCGRKHRGRGVAQCWIDSGSGAGVWHWWEQEEARPGMLERWKGECGGRANCQRSHIFGREAHERKCNYHGNNNSLKRALSVRYATDSVHFSSCTLSWRGTKSFRSADAFLYMGLTKGFLRGITHSSKGVIQIGRVGTRWRWWWKWGLLSHERESARKRRSMAV